MSRGCAPSSGRSTRAQASRGLGLLTTISLLVGCGDDAVLLEPGATPEGRLGVEPGTPPVPADAPPTSDPATSHTPATPLEDLGPKPGADEAGGFDWQLPPGFPLPIVPEDNPMTADKVELGRHLFYDRRLSGNESMSCASCHEQRLAFTDGRAVAVGATGESTPRSAMSLANVAYAATLTWGHPYLASLERQAQVPMFGDAPVELGLRSQSALEERLRAVPEYQALFALAFADEEEPITLLNVTRALASFQRTLLSGASPFDAWLYGAEEAAISESAKRGYALFNSEKLECFHCHLSFNFTDQVVFQSQAFASTPFHNTGLYNLDETGAFPEPNTGIFDVTRDPRDMGKFKAPTLRNIAITAPYMHDGSIASLSEVLDHYAAGGRTIALGENAGIGSDNPLKSNLVRGFTLTDEERADVLAFLESLTDRAFLENSAFGDPWLAP